MTVEYKIKTNTLSLIDPEEIIFLQFYINFYNLY